MTLTMTMTPYMCNTWNTTMTLTMTMTPYMCNKRNTTGLAASHILEVPLSYVHTLT